MTRASLREYAAVQRERYQQASRADKHRLLDEMVAVTGMHRKAAIRLLRRAPRTALAPVRAGRPRRYGIEVAAAAEVLWRASGRIGAHHLHPFRARPARPAPPVRRTDGHADGGQARPAGVSGRPIVMS